MAPPNLPDPQTGQNWLGHTPKTAGFRRLMIGLFFAGVATFAQLYSPQGLPPSSRGRSLATDWGASRP